LEHETVKWTVNKLKIEQRDAEKTFNLTVKAGKSWNAMALKAWTQLVKNGGSDFTKRRSSIRCAIRFNADMREPRNIIRT